MGRIVVSNRYIPVEAGTSADLDHLDTDISQRRVERRRELTGQIVDEEPKPRTSIG